MRIASIIGAAWLACGLLACGGSHKGPGKNTQGIGESEGEATGMRVPKVDKSLCDTDGKEVATFDLDRDDKPDVWKLYQSQSQKGTVVKIMTCKQVDLDHDHRIDYVAQYSDDGALIIEEYDADFDGKFDARIHYDKKTGRRYLVERTTDFHGKPTVWEKYDKHEKIASVLRDRNGDGKPDEWHQYKSGVIEAILYDDDFDGKVDRREETTKPRGPATDSTDDGAEPSDDTNKESETDGDEKAAKE